MAEFDIEIAPHFDTSDTVEGVDYRKLLLSYLTTYYAKDSLNTNFYKLITMYGDILTDLDYEVDRTILDNGIDEAREEALYPNFGYLCDLLFRGDFGWDYDVYRFLLKILTEAWTLYGSTAFGMRRAGQVVTGVSPYLREHYKYAGWILGQFILGTTTIVQTGGFAWTSVGSGFPTQVYDVWPQKMTKVWVCGSGVFSSSNAGVTWNSESAPAATAYYSIHGVNAYDTWVGGEAGGVGIISRWNFAEGWSATTVPNVIRGIWMQNSSNGLAVGDNGSEYVWDGIRWFATAPMVADPLYAVMGSPVSIHQYYIVGDNSRVLRYQGTGITTNVSLPVPGINLRGVYVLSNSMAYVCGENGSIYYTTNGGTSWTNIPAPTADHYYGIWVSSDASTIWVCGDNGTFYSSNDMGVTWTTLNYQGSVSTFRSLYMKVEEAMGYVCGEDGVVLRCNGQSPGYTLYNGTVLSNGALRYGAILESRAMRQNGVDVLLWNITDYSLLNKLLNAIKPAHIKLFPICIYPFLMEYYYYYESYDQLFYNDRQGHTHMVQEVGEEKCVVVNGRPCGESLSRITFGTNDLYVPQL